MSDYILFYSKGESPVWNPVYQPLPEKTVSNWYKHTEEGTGRRYNLADLTNPGYYEFLGVAAPRKGWQYPKDTMQSLHEEGRIVRLGATLIQKRYRDESKGILRPDIWTDISHIRGYSNSGEEQC